MPVHVERRLVPFGADQVFSIIADIERYPEFVPWCSAALIHERRRHKKETKETTVIAELQAAYGLIRKSFTSRAVIYGAEHRITMSLLEGPFRHMEGEWHVKARGETCQVVCEVDFAFEGRLTALIGERFLENFIPRLVDSFEARAHVLYGEL